MLRIFSAVKPTLMVVGGLLMVVFVWIVIGAQVGNRSQFAGGELREEVMDRWGAPIVQPAPSVRCVESGSVFKTLRALPLDSQEVTVDAVMNYRKRGLVYFSGFDFAFRGAYALTNTEARDLDVAFVFPINLQTNKVLLSDLSFRVGGQAERVSLAEGADKLVWTGRLAAGEKRTFEIAFRGRGLDSFTYSLDPDLPVRGFRLDVLVHGGREYDYPDGVVAATSVTPGDDTVALRWDHAALESGVPVGLILPSTQSWDRIIATVLRRSWAGIVLLMTSACVLASMGRRPLRLHEGFLIAAAFASFLILLPYLAAYLSFAPALVLSLGSVLGILLWYLRRVLQPECRPAVPWILAGSLLVPTVAVVFERYTGLVYTLEIVAVIVALMVLTGRGALRSWANGSGSPPPQLPLQPPPQLPPQEHSHAV